MHMKRVFTILTVLFAAALVSGSAHAQIYGTGKTGDNQGYTSYQNVPYYNQMVRDALKNKPPKFDFMQFRIYYSQTPQYDPMSEQALEEMNNYAFIVMNDEDPERVKSAMLAYKTVVTNHLANIDVVTQALSLAKDDKRFGNPEFFGWVKEGLIRTVMISGNGYTLKQAYDVITMQEEIILMGRLRLRPLSTVSRKEGVVYYNMHEVQNVDTGRTFTLFVNTTIPMKVIERREEEAQSYTLDIRKQ